MDIEYGVKTENKFSIVNTLDDEALDPSDILKKLESINAKDDKSSAAKKKQLKKPTTGASKTGSSIGTKGEKLSGGKTKESTDKENKVSGSSSSGASRNVDSSQNKRFPRGGSAQNAQSPRNRLPRQERSNIPPRFRQTAENDQAFQNGAAQQFGGGFLGYAPNEEQQLAGDGAPVENAVGGQPGFGTGFGTGFNVEEGGKDTGYRTRVFGRGGRRFNNGYRDSRGGYAGAGPRGRQFDRQSGSDKTGIKPIDKREGSGAHNWGSANRTDDLMAEGGEAEIDVSANNEEIAAKPDDYQENGGEFENAAEPEAEPEPEPVQLTLDEWKALQEPRSKPAFNVRRAGEGEKEKAEWKKLVPLKGDDLNKKKKKAKKEELVMDEEEEDEEYEDAQKLLPIDINFIGDAYRGGRGRGRGRGGRGGFGGGRGTGFGRGTEGRGTARDRPTDVPYTIDDETFPSLK